MPVSYTRHDEDGLSSVSRTSTIANHEASGNSTLTPRQSRAWDHGAAIMHPISAPPVPLPGNGFVRARSRIPPARSPKGLAPADSAAQATTQSQPSLRSLYLLTPSHPVLPPRELSAKVPRPSSPSASPRGMRDWDGSTSIVQPLGSPASPLPEVAPQRDAVTLALWKMIASHQNILSSHNFYAGMRKLFPNEMHIVIQELWVTMARSLGGSVSQLQFQVFFEKNGPDFLFGQDKRHKQLLPYMQPMHSFKHDPQADERVDDALEERERPSMSPPLWTQRRDRNQARGADRSPSPPQLHATHSSLVPFTPADASARARERLSHESDWSWSPQVHAQMGFLPVVLHTPRLSKSKKNPAASPKNLKSSNDIVRLQQYLSWMRTFLPSEDHESIGSDGKGLCNGLLLFKLIKVLGAPAERMQSLHLQMDQGVRTRRLWLRNMQAIGNCVIACSSSICVLEPELAVDGDAGALAALLRLIVQTFVIKKISKSRVIEWCAAHLQLLKATLHPQSVQFPYSNASLQQDFGDGLLLSLLLQRCIPAADEDVRSEAILLLQESDLHSSCYSNRHVALALIVTLGVPPYFNMPQLELKPIEHNFLWLQLNAIYLAFSSSLPAPAARVSDVESKIYRAADGRGPKEFNVQEQDSELKVVRKEKRALEAKSAELRQSMQRLHGMRRTLRVLTSPSSHNPSEMLQLAKKTQAQLQERSGELEDTSTEILTVKQALATVMQQQQEVQALVQEHNALTAGQYADASRGNNQSAHTIQIFLEKLQRATLLEESYAHRAALLRAAAEGLALEPDHLSASIAHLNPEIQKSIEKMQADLREMEQFFLQSSGSDLSASSRMLIDAKRAQLKEFISEGPKRLQPEEFHHIQTLLSSDLSLQRALEREAHVAHQLELLERQKTVRDMEFQQQRQQVASSTASSAEKVGFGAKSRRSSLRVQFSDTEQRDEDSGFETPFEVYSAELFAIQRLLQSKQNECDDDAVRSLKQILHRKQTRMLSLPLSKQQQARSAHARDNASPLHHRSDDEMFILNIINCSEGSCCSTDAAAWRMLWQSLPGRVAADLVCGLSKDSDAAVGRTGASVENAMAHIADALQRSASRRKFVFVYVSCPVAASQPAALQLGDGRHLSFDHLHAWLGSFCGHDLFLVFETGGVASAQAALDASSVNNFSGSIVSGSMGRVLAGVPCNPQHPFHRGIGGEMSMLSFVIIEALLSANSHLTCDELDQLLSSIRHQQNVDPSIISTRPVVVPSWLMTAQPFHHNHSVMQPPPQTSARHLPSSPTKHQPRSVGAGTAGYDGGGGITSVRQTLETQYPPMSPESREGSPMQYSPADEPGSPHADVDFSDDDDITPGAAWRM